MFLVGACLVLTQASWSAERVLNKHPKGPDHLTHRFAKAIPCEWEWIGQPHASPGSQRRRLAWNVPRFLNSWKTQVGCFLAAIACVSLAVASPYMSCFAMSKSCNLYAIYAFGGSATLLALCSAYTLLPLWTNSNFGKHTDECTCIMKCFCHAEECTCKVVKECECNNALITSAPKPTTTDNIKSYGRMKFFALLVFVACCAGASFGGIRMLGNTLTLSWQCSLAGLGLFIWLYCAFDGVFTKLPEIKIADTYDEIYHPRGAEVDPSDGATFVTSTSTEAKDRTNNRLNLVKQLNLKDMTEDDDANRDLLPVNNPQTHVVDKTKFDPAKEAKGQKDLDDDEDDVFADVVLSKFPGKPVKPIKLLLMQIPEPASMPNQPKHETVKADE